MGGSQAVGANEDYVFVRRRQRPPERWGARDGRDGVVEPEVEEPPLSGMLLVGKVLVFGDLDGQVHFLDRNNGTPLLRLPTDGSPVVGAPVHVGNTIAVTTRDGSVYAFRPE